MGVVNECLDKFRSWSGFFSANITKDLANDIVNIAGIPPLWI